MYKIGIKSVSCQKNTYKTKLDVPRALTHTSEEMSFIFYLELFTNDYTDLKVFTKIIIAEC